MFGRLLRGVRLSRLRRGVPGIHAWSRKRISAELVDRAESVQALTRRLPSQFMGMSPQGAAEAVYRALDGNEGLPSARSLAQAIRRVFEPLLTSAWQPVVYRDEDDSVVAYSAQPMRHLAATFREEAVETISRAIELGEGRDESGQAPGKHSVRSRRLVEAISGAIERLAGKLGGPRRRRVTTRRTRAVPGMGRADLRLSLADHAGRHRTGRRRAARPARPGARTQGAGAALPPPIPAREKRGRAHRDSAGSAELELRYLEQLRTLTQQAVSIQDVEDLEVEWRARQPAASSARAPKRSTGRKRTQPTAEVKGQPIFVGRSGAENDHVTFDIAGPDDTWLHARGVPGSHVIVRWNGANRDDDAVLLRAAELAAFYSQSRSSGRVEVDITARRFVRKIKGAGPGMVTYRNERTVSVAPVGPE